MRYELRLATSPRHRLRQSAAIGFTLGALLAFGTDAWNGPISQPRFWVIFLTSGVIAGMLFHRFLTQRGGFMPVLLDLGQVSLRMSTGRGQPLWEIPFHSLRIRRPEETPRESLLISGPGIRFLLNAGQLVALDGEEIDDPLDALRLLEHQLVTRSRPQMGVAPVGSATSPAAQRGEGVDDHGAMGDSAGSTEADPPLQSGESVISPQALASTASMGPATITLGVVLGLIFAVQYRLGAVVNSQTWDPLPLLSLGANSSPLVMQGEWHRLITGNLLHGDLRHLLFNGLALLSFGRFLEARLGSARFLLIFLASCLGGAMASAFLNNVLISIGASTGILGLVGAYGVVDWYFADDRRRSLRRQGILLFLALALPALLVPNADHFGHLGGLLVGMAVSALVLSPFDAITPELLLAAQRSSRVRIVLGRWFPGGQVPDDALRRRYELKRRVATAAATALAVLFVSVAGWTAWQRVHRDTRSDALSLMSVPELPPMLINNTAWTLAIDPEASRQELETAKKAMAWAAQPESAPASAEIDTLATLHFRLGEVERAVELQRWAFALDNDPELAAQLTRFLEARNAEQGPLLEGFEAVPEVMVDHGQDCSKPAEASTEGTSAVRVGYQLSTGVDPASAPQVHLLLEQNGKPQALLQVEIDAASPQPVRCSEIPKDLLSCDLEARVLAAVTSQPIAWMTSINEADLKEKASLPSCSLARLDEPTLELPGPLS